MQNPDTEQVTENWVLYQMANDFSKNNSLYKNYSLIYESVNKFGGICTFKETVSMEDKQKYQTYMEAIRQSATLTQSYKQLVWCYLASIFLEPTVEFDEES